MSLRKREPKERLSSTMKKLLENIRTYSLGAALDIMDIDTIQLKAMRDTNKTFNAKYLKALGISHKQDMFLTVYYSKAANIKSCCDAVGIARSTYDYWMNTNASFQALVLQEYSGVLDLTQSALIKNIQEGKESSIFYMLNKKGKPLGFIEKPDSIVIENNINIKGMSDEERDAKIAEYERILNGGDK